MQLILNTMKGVNRVFVVNIRFQLAAMCFLIVIIINYLKNKRLPLLSNKYFVIMMILAAVNLISDIAGIYTITHNESVYPLISKLCHRVCIGSIIGLLACLYLYVQVLVRKSYEEIRRRLIIIGATIVIVLVMPITYYSSEYAVYASGKIVGVAYIIGSLYLVAIGISIYQNRDILDKRKGQGIISVIVVWIIGGSIEVLFPGLLISSISATLQVLLLFLVLESPREYIDDRLECFNQQALYMVLTEEIDMEKEFYVINLVIENMDIIQRNFGKAFKDKLGIYINEYLAAKTNTFVYRFNENVVSVIYEGNNEAHVLERIRFLIERFKSPWTIDQIKLNVEAHVDIIRYPKYLRSASEICETIEYMAESYKSFRKSSEINLIDKEFLLMKDRYVTIERMLQEAIKQDGFDVVYQPIYDTKRDKFVSAEALVRLKDTRTVGFVSPEEFISIAEEKGMIMDIGEIVFRKVCEFGAKAKAMGLEIEYIEVNLSGVQVINVDLPQQLSNIMMQYGIEPNFINLEITETVSIESGSMLKHNMKELRDMGCSFSMDDFGTGYSNLSQMVEVSYDLIKIDKSLIWPCFTENSKNARVILENIVNMILQLGGRIVAEGVETEEQAKKLIEMQVDYLQGYYFSRPIKEKAFIEFLKQHEENKEIG